LAPPLELRKTSGQAGAVFWPAKAHQHLPAADWRPRDPLAGRPAPVCARRRPARNRTAAIAGACC